jgi:hypothetical protein
VVAERLQGDLEVQGMRAEVEGVEETDMSIMILTRLLQELYPKIMYSDWTQTTALTVLDFMFEKQAGRPMDEAELATAFRTLEFWDRVAQHRRQYREAASAVGEYVHGFVESFYGHAAAADAIERMADTLANVRSAVRDTYDKLAEMWKDLPRWSEDWWDRPPTMRETLLSSKVEAYRVGVAIRVGQVGWLRRERVVRWRRKAVRCQ